MELGRWSERYRQRKKRDKSRTNAPALKLERQTPGAVATDEPLNDPIDERLYRRYRREKPEAVPPPESTDGYVSPTRPGTNATVCADGIDASGGRLKRARLAPRPTLRPVPRPPCLVFAPWCHLVFFIYGRPPCFVFAPWCHLAIFIYGPYHRRNLRAGTSRQRGPERTRPSARTGNQINKSHI